LLPDAEGFVDGNMGSTAAAFLVARRASDINEDAAHQLRADGKKVGAIAPVEQAKVGFVDQSAGLQDVAGAFAGHVATGHLAQMVVNQRREFFEGGLVAGAPSLQEFGDFVSGRDGYASRIPSQVLYLLELQVRRVVPFSLVLDWHDRFAPVFPLPVVEAICRRLSGRGESLRKRVSQADLVFC
jgi:hypothetical protein